LISNPQLKIYASIQQQSNTTHSRNFHGVSTAFFSQLLKQSINQHGNLGQETRARFEYAEFYHCRNLQKQFILYIPDI